MSRLILHHARQFGGNATEARTALGEGFELAQVSDAARWRIAIQGRKV